MNASMKKVQSGDLLCMVGDQDSKMLNTKNFQIQSSGELIEAIKREKDSDEEEEDCS